METGTVVEIVAQRNKCFFFCLQIRSCFMDKFTIARSTSPVITITVQYINCKQYEKEVNILKSALL
jgi:hypothetical protein